MALVEFVKLNEIIDFSTHPDDDDDENTERPATGRHEAGAPVVRFLNSGYFPNLEKAHSFVNRM
jgi:hypothetical protein